MVRKVVIYTGRVQGVGFRYTAFELAGRFDVAGYVQNLDDGRVRLEAQGEPDQVQGLLNAVAHAMGSKITATDVSDYPPSAELGDPNEPGAFSIRRT